VAPAFRELQASHGSNELPDCDPSHSRRQNYQTPKSLPCQLTHATTPPLRSLSPCEGISSNLSAMLWRRVSCVRVYMQT